MPNVAFLPPPGLTNDNTMFALPGRWANGDKARFYNDNWQTKGGWERLTLTNLGGVCRAIHSWQDPVDLNTLAFGCHNALKVWRNGLVQDITPAAFVVGQTDGTGGAGYGTGAFGVGTYGSPSAADYFPLTWSMGNFGTTLIANPRGQKIFTWDTLAPLAVPMLNAPAKVTCILVTPSRQVLALGCNEEVSGTFNSHCIRWCDIEDFTDWTTLPSNNAGEWILESGGRIVTARLMGEYALVWTADALFLGTFLGEPGQTWKFDRVGGRCGAISPGAPIVRGQHVAWISPDRALWEYSLGGEPQPVTCDIHAMFADHIAQGQDDKIIGASVNTWQELTWFWPDDRDGLENSRALSMNPWGWSRDLFARSAYLDAGPQVFPVGVAPTGEVYWQEKGNSADGGQLSGFIESSDFYLGEADEEFTVSGMWPDFKNQIGPVQMTIFTRRWPQDTPRAHGPYTLSPGQPRRSFRASGRIARVRFDWGSAPAYVRGGKPEFDVAAIGGR